MCIYIYVYIYIYIYFGCSATREATGMYRIYY